LIDIVLTSTKLSCIFIFHHQWVEPMFYSGQSSMYILMSHWRLLHWRKPYWNSNRTL